MDAIATAFGLVFEPYVLLVILLSAAYGLFVGAIPGLTATMATALLVPVTFFMPPVPAVAAIVTATAMAIFSGDIPAALLRMPGTPASAAYADEAYLMTTQGPGRDRARRRAGVLGAGRHLRRAGARSLAAPALAEVALNFSSFEYFWLVMLGFTCAIFIAGKDPVKGIVSLLIGLLISVVGLENPAGAPRYTFGNAEMMGGIPLIPLMIGMFAVSEILRYAAVVAKPVMATDRPFGNVFAGMWTLIKKYPVQLFRGSALGTAVGALPGAGADIAAWMAYAMSKRFSKEPQKFGTGHVEGIVESGAANNSALGGAWIPALVFGIPGDSITAIAIGVLYLKGMNPGPTLFVNNPQNIYAVFIVFFLAQLLMLPLGWMAIKAAKRILHIPAARADAADPAVLRGRQLRHQQQPVRRDRDAHRRHRRLLHGALGLPGGADDPGRGAGHDAGRALLQQPDQGRRQLPGVLRAADRRHAGRAVSADLAVAGGAHAARQGRRALAAQAQRLQPAADPPAPAMTKATRRAWAGSAGGSVQREGLRALPIAHRPVQAHAHGRGPRSRRGSRRR